MKRAKNSKIVNIILHITGLLLCIVPPAVCTLSYFPLWTQTDSTKTLAGGCALLIILSAIPLFKFIKKYFESPASYVIWFLVFLLFFSLSKIAHEMTVIAFVGFVSNLIGAICFAIADKQRSKDGE